MAVNFVTHLYPANISWYLRLFRRKKERKNLVKLCSSKKLKTFFTNQGDSAKTYAMVTLKD